MRFGVIGAFCGPPRILGSPMHFGVHLCTTAVLGCACALGGHPCVLGYTCARQLFWGALAHFGVTRAFWGTLVHDSCFGVHPCVFGVICAFWGHPSILGSPVHFGVHLCRAAVLGCTCALWGHPSILEACVHFGVISAFWSLPEGGICFGVPPFISGSSHAWHLLHHGFGDPLVILKCADDPKK